jgi:hypothetical protein
METNNDGDTEDTENNLKLMIKKLGNIHSSIFDITIENIASYKHDDIILLYLTLRLDYHQYNQLLDYIIDNSSTLK